MCELENVKAGTRAFNAFRAVGLELQSSGPQADQKPTKTEAKLQKQFDAANKQLKPGGLGLEKGKGKQDGKSTDGLRIEPNTGRPVCLLRDAGERHLQPTELQI